MQRVKLVLTNISPLWFFVVCASVFGLAFLLITPPFQGADEPVHFLRAYQISEGNFVATKLADGKVGGYLPTDIGQIIKTTDTPVIQFYPQLKYKEYKTKAALDVPKSNKKAFFTFPASAPYAPTAYPLSSVGIFLTRLLRMPVMVAFYAARLGNLITWIVLIGLAIYLIPSRKWVLAVVGLLPMAIFQASTLNGDVMTVGTLALFLTLILKLRNNAAKVSTKSMVGLLITAILMVLSKDIMFVFLPLILLVQDDKFSNKRLARTFKFGTLLASLLIFGLWLKLAPSVSPSAVYGNHQNISTQLRFILEAPYSYINVLWNTYFYTWGDGITRSFIGTFGWADTPLSEGIVTLGYIGLFVLLVGSYERNFKEQLSRRGKQLLCLLGLLYWLAVSTALYLYYSPAGFKIIVGLQGRYYLPLILLAIPVLRAKSIKIDPALYRRVAIVLPLFLLVCSVITLYVRYFVNNV